MGRYNCLRPQEMDTHHHFPNKHNRGLREVVGCKTISSLGLEEGNFWKLLDTAMGSEKHSQAERHKRILVSPRCETPG
jgi:hypothetical protein